MRVNRSARSSSTETEPGRRALVLGGYGLIGSACLRALRQAGFSVTGMGRSEAAARAVAPDVPWVIRDLPAVTPGDWSELLEGVDVVVNAAGALQDGARDDLDAIHVTLIRNLVAGARGRPLRIVQISAAGVAEDASTEFFRSKARGDALLRAAPVEHVILRPVLVLSPEAYGGTALLRGAAGLPGVVPHVFPGSQVQTVHVEDVAAAVLAAAERRVPAGLCADLTEAGARPFPDLVTRIRGWLGFPEARVALPVPCGVLRLSGRAADLLAHLGWRTPLRSTALQALGDGITGDPRTWEQAGGAPCRSLDETLAALPATRQERLFARAYFVMPLAIAVLSVFWLVSGLIGLWQVGPAMEVLAARGMAPTLNAGFVIGGGLADIALGLAIFWRPRARLAALGMVLLSLAYMAGSAVLAPGLWADPLGPMVKVLPAVALALTVWVLLEER